VRPRALASCLAAVVTGAGGCSSIDPEVGPSQESCGVEPLGTTAAAGGGAYAGAATSSATPTTTPTTCSADAGSACDDCESLWCCPTRLACYEDPVCACADHALDTCTDAAGASLPAAGACWSAFAGRGTVEADRVACLASYCQGACAIATP
jgi:hypothetical protein